MHIYGQSLSRCRPVSNPFICSLAALTLATTVFGQGIVTTFAGTPGVGGHVDGTGTQALFLSPKAMSVDSAGNVYTVDNFCGTVRKITPAGVTSTIAGPPTACAFGAVDGTASDARFTSPSGTAVDPSGNVYIADSGNCTVRKLSTDGNVTTVAGQAYSCQSIDGDRNTARFNGIAGIDVGIDGNVYVTSWGDCTVRRVTPAGDVTTVAGVSAVCSSTDGTGTSARFGNPSGIASDGHGNFYIADETGCTVRAMTSAGVVTTLAGNPGTCGSADGQGANALFNVPSWSAVDRSGNVYISDYLNHTVRKVTQAGVVTTIAGLSGISGATNGAGPAALLNHPDGIAVDASGTVYVADRNNHDLRKIVIPGNLTLLATSRVSTRSSGLAYSRVTQTYNGTITITNTSASAIPGPFQVALISLTSGVTVANQSAYMGAPFVLVPNAAALAPGQSVSAPVQFRNPAAALISFTPAIYTGSIN